MAVFLNGATTRRESRQIIEWLTPKLGTFRDEYPMRLRFLTLRRKRAVRWQ